MSSSATGPVSAPLASSARSEATTVGSIGSECTVISPTTQIPAMRSSTPRKSNALLTPSARTISTSAAVSWPRWLERKIWRQRVVRPSDVA